MSFYISYAGFLILNWALILMTMMKKMMMIVIAKSNMTGWWVGGEDFI